jgi:hypothetical protein
VAPNEIRNPEGLSTTLGIGYAATQIICSKSAALHYLRQQANSPMRQIRDKADGLLDSTKTDEAHQDTPGSGTDEELADWKSQIVASNPSAKLGLRRTPYAFTEHGVAKQSSVLTSQHASVI